MPMFDVVTIGEALIDLAAIETGMSLTEVSSFKRIAGGAPANTAIGCSKLGRKTGFITRVGNEAFGRHIFETVGKYGVDTAGIQFDNEVNTGLAFIGLPTAFTREFLFYRNPGADMRISFEEIPEELFDTKFFHFGSISLINEPAAASTLKSVTKAKKNGSIISYDPNYRPSLWPSEQTAFKTIWAAVEYADIIKINDDEMRFLIGHNDLEAGVKKLLECGPQIVLCTKGEYGSIYATREYSGTKEIIKLDSVDSTGCGDSFISAVLSVLADYSLEQIASERKLLEKAVGFGAAAAALTSTRIGVAEALPDLDSVNSLIKKVTDV